MKITKVEIQKKNDKRCSVFIDHVFAFGVTVEDAYLWKLREGREMTEEELEEIQCKNLYQRAKDRALQFLGFKARTEQQLKKKLIEDEYPEFVIENVIEFLKSYGYLDDDQYAGSYIRERMRLKPMGKRRIVYELREKGISAEKIERTIEGMELNELEHAYTLLIKKMNSMDLSDFKQRNKAYQFLLRRGFSSEVISKAFLQLENDENGA